MQPGPPLTPGEQGERGAAPTREIFCFLLGKCQHWIDIWSRRQPYTKSKRRRASLFNMAAAGVPEKQPELAKVAHAPPPRDAGSLGWGVSALKHLGSAFRDDQAK